MLEEQRPQLGYNPAFPNESSSIFPTLMGLTQREHYAALFVAGMCANSAIGLDVPPQDLARVAITQADVLVAMLAEADREDS